MHPDAVPLSGGVEVTIEGDGFVPGPELRVSFGEYFASVVRATPTEVVVTSPAVPPRGSGLVTVRVFDELGEISLAGGIFIGETGDITGELDGHRV